MAPPTPLGKTPVETQERYRHTQIAYIMLPLSLFPIVLAIAFISAAWGSVGWTLLTLIVAVPLVLLGLAFMALTVIVRDDVVEIRFCLGLFRKRYPLREFTSVSIERHPWYATHGLYWTPGGWHYSVAGRHGVVLKKERSGVWIGTNDPEGLEQALREAMGQAPSESEQANA